jgi:thioesterase domain-containing protein/acyl carrier protein
LPLNTNGKIDRGQLPKPGFTGTGAVGQPPATDLERRIARVWSQVLDLVEVPADQSFFTLGGTSASALKVVAHIEHELGVELPLPAFYAAPTVAGLAVNLGKHFSPDAPIVACLRQGAPEQPPLFCLFGVTLYQDLALALTEDRSVFGVHVPFRHVPGRDARPSIAQIARRYVEIVRKQQPRGPYHLLGLCFGGVVAYEVARQLLAVGETVASVTIIDAVLPHGLRVDQRMRVRHVLQRVWRDPAELGQMLRRRLERLPGWRPAEASDLPIDMAVDGPEADADVARFAACPSKLATRVLVVCAGKEPWPDYVRVAPDQGWGGWADTVLVRSVPANHLGVLREPHVRLLAQAVSEVCGAMPTEAMAAGSRAEDAG